MALIKDWSSTAASNNSTPPDGAPEGMLPSTVNNVIRENMASIRTQLEDTEWFNYGDSGTQASATTFTITGDVTARYTADRAIKIVDASTLTGFVVSSSYGAPDTTVTVEMTGSLTATMNGETISLGVIKPSSDSLPKNYKYNLHVYAADAEASDTYVITVTPSPIALEAGMVFNFKANTANTGAATLNVNSLGAVTIKKEVTSDLANNDILANQIVSVIYDGTNFQVIGGIGGGIKNVVEDTTPEFGGNVSVNGNKIVSASSGDIDIEPDGTGNVLIGNFTFDADQTVGAGQDNYVLTYDDAGGLISLEAAAGGGSKPDKEITYLPGSFESNNANPASLEFLNGTNVDTMVRAFDDTTVEYVNGKFVVPGDVNTGGTVTFRMYGMAATAAASRFVEFTFESTGRNDAEDFDIAYADTIISGDLAIDTTQDNLQEDTWSETITNLGWAANDLVFFRLSRTPPTGTDLTGDFYLFSFTIEIPRT